MTEVSFVKQEFDSIIVVTDPVAEGPTQAEFITPPVSPTSGRHDPLQLARHRLSDDAVAEAKRRGGKKLAKFYENQNELIDDLLTPLLDADADDDELDEKAAEMRAADSKRQLALRIAVNGSFAANVMLFILQVYAAVSSGSLSLFATMADSFMDLLSSAILWYANRAASEKNTNYLKYPVGRSRMETTGIIIFACLMSTVSVQLIIESARTLAKGQGEKDDHKASTLGLIFVGIAIAVKFGLYLYCRAIASYFPAARIFATDHRNDLSVNGFGLIMSILGSRVVWYLDPIGAIVIALFILRSWVATAYEHVQLIVGKAADTAILQKITYLALTHDPENVVQVDTCRAYHAGENLFVEVDIVLKPDTPLRVAHDVGESLQNKLEMLPNVERAFVHLDVDSVHPIEHRKRQ
ncbi:hypothetical protein GQ42DRAFT_119009 [Ramicandelaber brevisporus]|nr:hypothetical protein GQ42DRAFT_119009 [Ramicandelaber brevisporus]